MQRPPTVSVYDWVVMGRIGIKTLDFGRDVEETLCP